MAVFKRANGHIFGVQFSAKEQKAIDAEILRQCAEYDKKNADEVDAVILCGYFTRSLGSVKSV